MSEKPPKSAVLIEKLLINLDAGHITGKESTLGPALLRELSSAFRAILQGEDVDSALGIERSGGRAADRHTVAMAWIIHRARAAGEKWSVVEALVNEYRADLGLNSISRQRMTTIHSHYKSEIEHIESVQILWEMLKSQ